MYEIEAARSCIKRRNDASHVLLERRREVIELHPRQKIRSLLELSPNRLFGAEGKALFQCYSRRFEPLFVACSSIFGVCVPSTRWLAPNLRVGKGICTCCWLNKVCGALFCMVGVSGEIFLVVVRSVMDKLGLSSLLRVHDGCSVHTQSWSPFETVERSPCGLFVVPHRCC